MTGIFYLFKHTKAYTDIKINKWFLSAILHPLTGVWAVFEFNIFLGQKNKMPEGSFLIYKAYFCGNYRTIQAIIDACKPRQSLENKYFINDKRQKRNIRKRSTTFKN